MKAFFDTSAYVKRYIDEVGSDVVNDLSCIVTEYCLSIICLPEAFSTFSRLKREDKINKYQYNEIKSQFVDDIADVTICELPPVVVKQTIKLLENYRLRAMDAIHIASALEYQCDLFVSADRRQLEAAESSGLTVEYIK